MKFSDMLLLALDSVARFTKCCFMHVLPSRDRGFLRALKHICLMTLLWMVGLIYLLIQWLLHLLDECFFPKYRKQTISGGVFIVGLPRSGTTSLQRTIAKDTQSFTTVKTWEAIFAPTIIQKKAIRLLAHIEPYIGKPIAKLGKLFDKRLAQGGMGDVHKLSLSDPEEDFIFLFPAMACIACVAIFPKATDLWQLADFTNAAPPGRKSRLVNFYEACLKKHLFVQPANKRLLSKNASFISWAPELQARFHDSTFICCRRDLQSVIPSQISSLEPTMQHFAFSEGVLQEFQTKIVDMIHHYEKLADQQSQQVTPAQWIDIAINDLNQDLEGCVTRVYESIEAEVPTLYQPKLEALSNKSKKHRSHHHYSLKKYGLKLADVMNPGLLRRNRTHH